MTGSGGDDPVRLFTDQEVASFRSDGWARVDRLVDTSVAEEMLVEAKSLIEGGTDFEAWQDYKRPARDDGREPFRSVAYSHNMVHNIQRLTGREEAIRLWADTIACKQPAGSRIGAAATRWHQDLPHYPQDRVGHTAIWLALDEVTPERGAMRFLTGSHREGPLGKVFGNDEPDVLDRYPDLKERYPISEPLHLQAGDATCHHCLTVHGAPENSAGVPRWSFIFTYIPEDVLYTGAPYHLTDGAGLTANGPFDSSWFPVVGITP
jgi:ectoine hydroxylase-related dioxygenase (phytanoyl-CoA dioxygenase family)